MQFKFIYDNYKNSEVFLQVLFAINNVQTHTK